MTKVNTKDDVPVGSIVEFTKDKKAKITVKANGKEETTNVDYTLEGNKLTLHHGAGPKGGKQATITKLSEKEMVLEADKMETLELRRKE
ncbi:hypothetical protein FRUB_03000 [Fimbriiglobus ruber]|uniref:Lipocalin-like domain-containing protein n=1 Tax=Fimbriiglobus ruber TaxID=1908690 RepID=A0A225DQ57_9BACT|nr:hypothetical protein FRUB_03000 [Fimbriiglobus ruber]